MVLPTCGNCGAGLSLPADKCQNCGQPLTVVLTGQKTTPRPPLDDENEPGKTVPPSGDDGDDGGRVETLLRQIAAQSHFEERYELQGKISAGGMGQILRAHDRILRRQVAIKMMLTASDGQGSSPAIRGQFLKEARVGGRLLHPNVLPVFDLGVNRSNQIYYTMRLIDGSSLQNCLAAIDKGVLTRLINFPLRKLIESFVGACQGVDYAHQNGVVHLDIKPHNILVSGFSEVFVIDWGLAKVDDVNDSEELADLYRGRSSPHLTASNTGVFGGAVIGTPGYMAPEQARGEFHTFDATTDVFALGGVLYSILYDQPPNQGQGVAEILLTSQRPKQRGKLRQGILPRSRRVPKESLAAVDALETICLKALEIDRENRYQTVDTMIVELNEWLASTPGPPHGF
jgi:serine/threonine protein kinase